MCVDHQILILEWFVKDHVTLKTGVMMLKITEINYTLLYIHMIYCILDHRNEVVQLFIQNVAFLWNFPKFKQMLCSFFGYFASSQFCGNDLNCWRDRCVLNRRSWAGSGRRPQTSRSPELCVCVCVCVSDGCFSAPRGKSSSSDRRLFTSGPNKLEFALKPVIRRQKYGITRDKHSFIVQDNSHRLCRQRLHNCCLHIHSDFILVSYSFIIQQK